MITYKSYSEPFSLFLPSNSGLKRQTLDFLASQWWVDDQSDPIFDNGKCDMRFLRSSICLLMKKRAVRESLLILLLPYLPFVEYRYDMEAAAATCNHRTISVRMKKQQIVEYNGYRKE